MPKLTKAHSNWIAQKLISQGRALKHEFRANATVNHANMFSNSSRGAMPHTRSRIISLLANECTANNRHGSLNGGRASASLADFMSNGPNSKIFSLTIFTFFGHMQNKGEGRWLEQTCAARYCDE